MSTGERLQALVDDVELTSLHGFLAGLSDSELDEAKRWYRANQKRIHNLSGRDWDSRTPRQRESHHLLVWCEALCAAALAGPSAAADAIQWRWFWDHQLEGQEDLLVDLLSRRGQAWCQDFVAAASTARISRNDLLHASGTLFTVLRRVIARVDLSCPTGDSFLFGWMTEARCDPVTDRLRTDPLMPDALLATLRSEHLGGFQTRWGGPADLADAVATLSEEGQLDRTVVIETCLQTLTRPTKPSAQRMIAKILQALDFSAKDLPDGLPLVQSLLATCHGSVCALLQPIAFELVEGEDDLLELTNTVAGRTERKQRTELVKALGTANLSERVGVSGIAAAAELLRANETDAELLTALAKVSPPPAELAPEAVDSTRAPQGLWDVPIPVAADVPEVQWPKEFTNELLLQLRHRIDDYHWSDHALRTTGSYSPSAVPFDLGFLARWAHFASSAKVREVVRWMDLKETNRVGGPLTHPLRDWAEGSLTVDSFWEAVRRSRDYLPRPWEYSDGHDDPFALYDWGTTFIDLLARESLLRADWAPTMLSTPTHQDGTLTFERLAARVRILADRPDGSFGPLDLFQALLRLRTVPAEDVEARLAELDGVRLPVDPDFSTTDEPCGVPDAVQAIETWLRAGGLPPLRLQATSAMHGGQGWTASVDLSIALELFPSAPQGLFTSPRYTHWGQAHALAVLPQWPDAYLVQRTIGLADFSEGLVLKALLGVGGRLGVAANTLAISALTNDEKDVQLSAVESVVTLMGQGRFDPESFASAGGGSLWRGQLKLARLAYAVEQVFLAGGMRLIWQPVLTIAASGCVQDRKPAGLADLLRMLAAYAAEVPAEAVCVPEAITGLAAQRGSSKCQLEARALVAALEQRASASTVGAGT